MKLCLALCTFISILTKINSRLFDPVGFGGYYGSDSMGGRKDHSSFGYGNLAGISYSNKHKSTEDQEHKATTHPQEFGQRPKSSSLLGDQEETLHAQYSVGGPLTESVLQEKAIDYESSRTNSENGNHEYNNFETKLNSEREDKKGSSDYHQEKQSTGQRLNDRFYVKYQVDLGQKERTANWEVEQDQENVHYRLNSDYGHGGASQVYFRMNNSH